MAEARNENVSVAEIRTAVAPALVVAWGAAIFVTLVGIALVLLAVSVLRWQGGGLLILGTAAMLSRRRQ